MAPEILGENLSAEQRSKFGQWIDRRAREVLDATVGNGLLKIFDVDGEPLVVKSNAATLHQDQRFIFGSRIEDELKREEILTTPQLAPELKQTLANEIAILDFYPGGTRGVDWFNLKGPIVETVQAIQQEYGEASTTLLNRELGPKVESFVEIVLEGYENQARLWRKPRNFEVSQGTLTNEYIRLERCISAFRGLLERYRRGEPVLIYVGAISYSVDNEFDIHEELPTVTSQSIFLQKLV